jgi:sensor domain CHASE-containing protein
MCVLRITVMEGITMSAVVLLSIIVASFILGFITCLWNITLDQFNRVQAAKRKVQKP